MYIQEYKNIVPEYILDKTKTLVDDDMSRRSKETYVDAYLGTDQTHRVVLGESIYILDQNDPIDKNIRSYIKERYDFLHDFLDDFISEYTNKPVIHREDLPYPGFHVISNDTKLDAYSWHYDNVLMNRFQGLDYTKIMSIVIPISLNKNAHLEYKADDVAYKHMYNVGDIYMWYSSLEHRIGVGDFTGTEARITYQSHIYMSESEVWVYF